MNDRAVSVTVNYTLSIAVAMLLVSGLLFAAGDMIDTRQEEAIRTELDVVGQRLATGLMTADRLVQAGGDEVSVRVSIPDRVAESGYSIEVDASASDSVLRLESHDPPVSVNVSFANRTHVESSTLAGGDVRIVLGSDGDLEAESA